MNTKNSEIFLQHIFSDIKITVLGGGSGTYLHTRYKYRRFEKGIKTNT